MNSSSPLPGHAHSGFHGRWKKLPRDFDISDCHVDVPVVQPVPGKRFASSPFTLGNFVSHDEEISDPVRSNGYQWSLPGI